MNRIQQLSSTAIDMSGLTANEQDGLLILSGEIQVHGNVYPVDALFDPAETPTIYAHVDGTVSGEGEGGFAHVAWHDGEAWNFIEHPVAEPETPPVAVAAEQE